MQQLWSSLYTLVLALWVGGMALFTFIVTPVLFRSFTPDLADRVVGKLFPGYFLYNLILSAAALALYLVSAAIRTGFASRFSPALLTLALLVNIFIVFKLHPEAVKVKQEIASFEQEALDSPARKKFSKLHGVSVALNLFLLVAGILLLVAGSLL